jgi:aspartate/glutamate racemase/prolyl-tRNA editing enzyme YbaK/EbsC (Cys-tRNA(Pro) deacylase)
MIIGKYIPHNVQDLSSLLKQWDLWHIITNNEHNQEAYDCERAVAMRTRLGNVGIPLWDELKSNLVYYDSHVERKYALLHCRGNQKLEPSKVINVLGAEYTRLPKEALRSVFNCEYGLVNPFNFATDFPDVEQIFDLSVMEDYFPPYTLMTNAGDMRWGIEFRANELVNAISSKRVADIVMDNSKFHIRKHKIGILTGNSPESGILLWQRLNETIRTRLDDDFLGDLSLPTVLVNSMPEMGLSMELDIREDDTWKIVERGITTLCEDGATIIGIACNTTQYFSERIREICEKYDAEFISMADAVNYYLVDSGMKHFDFLGIKFVTDFGKWSDFGLLNELYQVEIPSEFALAKMHQIALDVKKKTVDSNEGRNKLRDLINKSTKTKNIIIALTEISTLLATQKQKKDDDTQFIDTLTLLAQRMADRYLKDYSGMLLINQTVSKKHQPN